MNKKIKQRMSFRLGIILLVAMTGRIAGAVPWCHANLRATDGTIIRIDYQVATYQPMRMPTYYVMRNVYLHVENDSFSGEEMVSVVFLNPPSGLVLSGIDFDRTKFTSRLPGTFIPLIQPTGQDGGGSHYHIEVAAVINGIWIADSKAL